MSIPSISSVPPAATTSASSSTRSADGDSKVRSAATSQTKDADGDDKAAPRTPAGGSSTGVQAVLGNLVKGG